jgi:hypothetical protein
MLQQKISCHRSRFGFHLIVANSVAQACNKTEYFDIGAIVIDHELTNDIDQAAR